MKLAAIMALIERRHVIGHHVRLEVGRHIGDPDPGVPETVVTPEWLGARGIKVAHVGARASELMCRRAAHREKRERPISASTLHYGRNHALFVRREIAPVRAMTP